jgi:hypothetical protein
MRKKIKVHNSHDTAPVSNEQIQIKQGVQIFQNIFIIELEKPLK